MDACGDALEGLRGIAGRLNTLGSFGNERELQSEQINVVQLIRSSDCPALKSLAQYVDNFESEYVLWAWKSLVVNGLEPTEPGLAKVCDVENELASGEVRIITTSPTMVNGVPMRSGTPGPSMNLWVGHAKQVVAALIRRVAAAADNGDAKPETLAAGAEAIDEADVALLGYLDKSPNLRRKVSDVQPDYGPLDRKAVAKRLRKLANRTPPLVDYPKNSRSGVAITNAGKQALKQATAPKPH